MGRISDLILETGRAKAQGQAASGQIWGNTVQNLGQMLSQVPGQIQQHKAQDAAQQRDARIRQILPGVMSGEVAPEMLVQEMGPEGLDVLKGIEAYRNITTQRTTNAKKEAGDLALAFKRLPQDMRAQLWPNVRKAAITGGLGTDETIPLDPTDDVLDGIYAWSSGKPHEAPKVGTREIKVRNADGSETIQIVEDKPGFSATSAAEKPSDFEWVVRNGRPTQIAKGAAQPGDRPYEKPTQGPAPNYLTLISPNGQQQTRVVDGPAANSLMQQGWKLYDAVAARQQNGAQDPKAEALDTAREVLRVAGELYREPSKDEPQGFKHGGFDDAFGVMDSMTLTLDQDTADAEVLRDTLTSLMTLENMGKMKGVLSDSDMKIIRQASTALNSRMGDKAAAKEVQRVRQVMQKIVDAAGVTTPAANAGAAATTGKSNPYRDRK